MGLENRFVDKSILKKFFIFKEFFNGKDMLQFVLILYYILVNIVKFDFNVVELFLFIEIVLLEDVLIWYNNLYSDIFN